MSQYLYIFLIFTMCGIVLYQVTLGFEFKSKRFAHYFIQMGIAVFFIPVTLSIMLICLVDEIKHAYINIKAYKC